MKRLVLFVVALVFAFCTTVMAVDKPAVAPTKDEAVTIEKADAAKVEVKKAAKKVEEEAPAAPAAK